LHQPLHRGKEKIMPKLSHAFLPAVMAAALSAPLSAAEEAAPPSPHTVTANVSLVSTYIFRGLTQTWDRPALQGGADYAHAGGWYAGLWGSAVSGNQYPGGSGLELDYYGGYNGKITDDLGWTAGIYGYWYPGASFNKANPPIADEKFDNLELNVGLSYKWVNAKYSRSVTDYFGANTNTGYTSGTEGSGYFEVNAAIPLRDDLTLGLHAAHTDVKADLRAPLPSGATDPDYNDYRISLTKTFKDGWNLGIAYTYADNTAFYDRAASLVNAGDTKDLGGSHWVLFAGRTF